MLMSVFAFGLLKVRRKGIRVLLPLRLAWGGMPGFDVSLQVPPPDQELLAELAPAGKAAEVKCGSGARPVRTYLYGVVPCACSLTCLLRLLGSPNGLAQYLHLSGL